MQHLFQLIGDEQALNHAHEVRFIQDVLLKGCAYQLKSHEPQLFKETVVYLELFNPDYQWIRKLRSQGKKVVLIHMGDEFAKKDISAYGECDLVLRSYFFPEMFDHPHFQHKMVWIPNGYKSGVGPRPPQELLPVEHRTQFAAFLGWIHNPDSFNRERDSFARVVREVHKNPGERYMRFQRWFNRKRFSSQERRSFSSIALNSKDLYLLSSSGFASGKNVGLYSTFLENTVFAPCPAGNSPETIRLYDVLESGAIPISLDHEFLRSPLALGAIGDVPFPILKHWEELPAFLSTMKECLIENPMEIHALQQKCIRWWAAYKTFIQEKIESQLRLLNVM